jgi:hypothetical protein
MWLERPVVRTAFAAALVCSLSFGTSAHAAPAKLSELEATTFEDAAARLGIAAAAVEAPEGMLIERVDIVPLDVFDEHDPVPDGANVVHATTRRWVIRQELLFQTGERFSAHRAEESARNLRKLRQLSVVLVVPVAGSAPDRVRVLVITRDVWSLKLNWDLSASAGSNGTTINRLVINPTEENFLGTHTIVGGIFTLDAGSYSFGMNAANRRLFGTDIQLNAVAGVVYGRVSGRAEGSYGTFTYGSPLRSTDDHWGWGTGITFRDDIARRFDVDGRVQRYDADVTPEDDRLPIEYERERFVGGVEVVRSFGRTDKYDLAFGAEADRTLARYLHPSAGDPAAVDALVDEWLPVNDTRLSPFVQLRTHREHYFHTHDLETLALGEDYRLGPEILLRAYPASTRAGSTRDMIGLKSGLSYTLSFGDGMARLVALNSVEYELHGDHQASIEAQAHAATPRLDFGRFVFDGVVADAYENYLNRNYSIGGSGRLRGYPLTGFEGSPRGTTVVAGNAEFRTTSRDIWSMRVGLAAFYDVGAAADGFEGLAFLQSVGAGLRILFPQLDRTVFRLDYGFPLSPGYATLPGALFVSFGQAFSMPELETPTVMDPELQ